VEERTLGVDTSFWIAIALTYLEFLEEREVSILSSISLLRNHRELVLYIRVTWLQPAIDAYALGKHP
jgi:hypothetical protein